MTLKALVQKTARQAKAASRILAKSSTQLKNKALENMARSLRKKANIIIRENKKDLLAAKKANLSKAMIDRLSLNKKRIEEMAASIDAVIKLKDPCGAIDKMWKRPNRLVIGKMRVPIGLIGIIYESRPNVTSDCATLCIKSGNAVILKGGKESINSNLAIYKILRAALKESGLPEDCISMVESVDRKVVAYLLEMDDCLDLIIPRGGEALIRMIADKSKIPVIKHYKGVCHVYVDKEADLKKALNISINAKVQRPGVCNAMETLLVHKDIAGDFLPKAIDALVAEGVEIRGCTRTRELSKNIKKATESDWYEEFLDLILAVKVVRNTEEAINHIAKYGSGHSDSIVTENYDTSLKFLKEVDSACVYANASTRFTDGYQFGFGAEIGISTDKIHARGPMALEELTIYKYIIFGSGQIRK
ncbi:MAG: glutamate-5-semialdehyde dehydrogenase [Candidatus Orphnella occulta]|nr:glutamate-5-semialdehyde dehydrogenase [Candidatus Orphnella occulta]MDP8297357.1 glutamate-5-semialdehyde dehydrogenase [Candidatus Orphnella occulta]